MQEIQFDYFRGMEAEQYSFYRVPKVLFTAECFKSLSCEAKVLYGLMLDRMSLSIKNRWFDEEDRVYIIFTVEEIAELLNCGTQKAVKLMKELDDNQGIGLIEKKRLGLGKPNVIYVKNFILKEKCSPEQRGKAPENLGNTQNSENHNSRIVKTTNQELPESQFKNDENHTSRIVEITTQEVPNSQSNNTDINNTDFNETDFNEIDSIQSYLSPSAGEVRPVGEDVIERMETYRALIQENIDYECFLDRREKEDVDELIELMVEILMMPDAAVDRRGRCRVSVNESAVSEADFHSHIEYVLFSLQPDNKHSSGEHQGISLTTPIRSRR